MRVPFIAISLGPRRGGESGGETMAFSLPETSATPDPSTDRTWRRFFMTPNGLTTAGLFAVANGAAAVVSAEMKSWNTSAIIAGITVVSATVMGSIKMLAPVITEAIRSIGPALAELQKQREEIYKGSLSSKIDEMKDKLDETVSQNSELKQKLDATLAQNAEMKAEIKLASDRVEDANKKLHDAKNQANLDSLNRQAEIQVIKADLESARSEIAHLRDENLALTRVLADRTERMGREVRANTQDIRQATDNIAVLARDSGSFPVVPSDVTPPMAAKNSKPTSGVDPSPSGA